MKNKKFLLIAFILIFKCSLLRAASPNKLMNPFGGNISTSMGLGMLSSSVLPVTDPLTLGMSTMLYGVTSMITPVGALTPTLPMGTMSTPVLGRLGIMVTAGPQTTGGLLQMGVSPLMNSLPFMGIVSNSIPMMMSNPYSLMIPGSIMINPLYPMMMSGPMPMMMNTPFPMINMPGPMPMMMNMPGPIMPGPMMINRPSPMMMEIPYPMMMNKPDPWMLNPIQPSVYNIPTNINPSTPYTPPSDTAPEVNNPSNTPDIDTMNMLILLERCHDIADEFTQSRTGRPLRIEHYRIHGTDRVFAIPTSARYSSYNHIQHFYYPPVGKAISAHRVGQVITPSAFAANGFAPDIVTDPYPVPDYEWWYGCVPTSAGMMMGFYDWNGYPNMIGTALQDTETTNFGSIDSALLREYMYNFYNDLTVPPPPEPTLLCNKAIASAGHLADFWVEPESLLPDPLASGRIIPDQFDCLADFMGTSQLNLATYYDPETNTTETISYFDGQTLFILYYDGTPLDYTFFEANPNLVNASGMYGLIEYAQYRGYTATAFNQYTDVWVSINAPTSTNPGFTFEDFKNEILAGRPVLTGIVYATGSHLTLGFGYYEDLTTTPPTQEILLRDTWSEATSATGFYSMPWNGTYPNPHVPEEPYEVGMVYCFTLTSAPVP